jgi:mannose-1-phosphate guanylyltransferase
MEARRVRALVLAAGLGTRLRPLSSSLPKPLFPVCGLPILGHTLAALARAGCEAVAINLHYRGDQIRDRFGGSFAGLPLTYSDEPAIQGTLGALYPVRDFLRAADLVVLVNGDSLCRWPLARMIRAHLRSRRAGSRTAAQATLLLARRADPADFGGGVGVDREGRVVSFRPASALAAAPGPADSTVERRLVFAGAHVLEPALLDRVGAGPADIVRDLYESLLSGNGELGEPAVSPILGIATDRVWHDLGTPRRYLDGVLDWVRTRGRGSWISPEATLGPSAGCHHSVVEAGARVGEGARLERALVLAGAEVGAGCVVGESIVGPSSVLAPGSRLERQLAMAGPGGACVTPLDGGR